MKKTWSKVLKYKKISIVALVAVLLLIFMLFSGGGSKMETFTVTETNVEQSVLLSGKIETRDKADLGFATGGRLARILVKNDQAVTEGAILAQLEIGDLLADLEIKQASSRSSFVDLSGAKDDLEKITKQENNKVNNAYRNLLSEDLVLAPDVPDYDLEPPTVGGIYDGKEGQYKIIIEKENEAFTEYRLRVFGLEKNDQIINENGATPLGTKGLYVTFPAGELASYKDTIWYLNIPNKSSTSYVTNFNEYNEAKDSRDLAIKNAETAYEKLITKGDAGSSIGEAEIQKIRAEIRKNTIYAPFAGRVTNIEKEVGENASTGERVITVLGENKLEVVLQVSELDVSKLTPDSPIEITLDAFPGEKLSGILKTVNSRETEIEGVPVYEAFVELPADARIKTGMSANGRVILAKKEAVLAVPSYVITKKDNKNFVTVVGEDGNNEEREVSLGLLGTDNMVEVVAGLESNDKILFSSENK